MQLLRHPALHELGMVEVELHLDVGCTDVGGESVCVGLAVEGVARIVAGIEGLHEESDAGLGRARGRPAKVRDERRPALLVARPLARHPPHRVQSRAAGRPAVPEREVDGLLELRLTSRQAPEPALPFPARRHVEHDDLEVVLTHPLGDSRLGRF